ncbi:UNVERIFIED_CONTAM: hypothetical protein FKN15_055075 [Acipenser sinensis]
MTKSKITKPESESVEIKSKKKQKTKKRVAEEMEQKPCEEKEQGEPERKKNKKRSKIELSSRCCLPVSVEDFKQDKAMNEEDLVQALALSLAGPFLICTDDSIG